MGNNTTQETLELLKAAQSTNNDDILKAFTQAGSAISGLTAYDLQAPALRIYPVLTPLRNTIPRVSGKGGIQANWRAITGININSLNSGVSQGNRGGIITTQTADYLAAYKGLGLEDYVSFEADYAAGDFDDIKARAAEGLLRSLMIGEENVILGGNTSLALGTTPTPTLTASTTGGTLATQTLSVICVALGYDAYWAVAGLNNGFTGSQLAVASAVVPAAVSRTNADGTTDSFGGGSARKSTNATVSVTGATGSATASVTAVNGAVGYAWYWGAAGSEVLGAVTTINSVSITATATGAQTAASLPAADNSTNSLVFDGLLTQVAKSALVKTQATGTAGTGTPLTADGAAGIVEFDSIIQTLWNLYRLGPTTIYLNAQELLNANKKVIAGGGTPLFRFTMDAQDKVTEIVAGGVIGSYLNKITGELIKLAVHPTIPPGTVLFYTASLPYKLSGITNVLQIRARQDYYQIEWPRRSRKYEYGIYADEVLQNYFPPAFAILNNIGNG